MHSQSIQLSNSSVTYWVPYVTSVTAETEVLSCLQEHYSAVTRVVANLSTIQCTPIYDHANPHMFHPHIGLFSAEYALGCAFSQKR